MPIAPLRGLPPDFDYDEPLYRDDDPCRDSAGNLMVTTLTDLLGDRCHSWLGAQEIFDALPAIAVVSLAVPHAEYLANLPFQADLAEWASRITTLRDDYGWDANYWKLLGIKVDPSTTDTDPITVHCTFDFSLGLEGFTDLIRALQKQHGDLRFVYGYA